MSDQQARGFHWLPGLFVENAALQLRQEAFPDLQALKLPSWKCFKANQFLNSILLFH